MLCPYWLLGIGLLVTGYQELEALEFAGMLPIQREVFPSTLGGCGFIMDVGFDFARAETAISWNNYVKNYLIGLLRMSYISVVN